MKINTLNACCCGCAAFGMDNYMEGLCSPITRTFKKINGVLKTFEEALLEKNIITHKVTVEANIVA